jgi:uncharacterized membrane protein
MNDVLLVLRWWLVWISLGWIGWPIAKKLFSNWFDRGYAMAKIVGIGILTWVVWILGMMKAVPLGWFSIGIAAMLVAVLGWTINRGRVVGKINWRVVIVEEVVFGLALLAWSWVKAHEPTINGLEKFMDFGFTKSILQSKFFPPDDMWYAGQPINYYYFGHLIMAMVTKISGIDLAYTFNLMLATLFALCVSMGGGIGWHLLSKVPWRLRVGGVIFTCFLLSLSGNLQTIYAFTKGYSGDDSPPPFWKIWSNFLSPTSFWTGWNAYWYPNATRFIPYTIHEFPGYSFVVSDVHGHVLGIPLALLAIGLLITIWESNDNKDTVFLRVGLGVALGLSFMTNALDGPIYFGLYIWLMLWKEKLRPVKKWLEIFGLVVIPMFLTILPFLATFKPFVSGIAVNCPPTFFQNTKIGPLMFEGVEKCQKSPLWMMTVLWGFFAYCMVGLWRWKENKGESTTKKMFLIMAIYCAGLIIFPEFFYFKDIYPMHFRSNTMFKLGYQVFMMMSIGAGYTIVMWLRNIKNWKHWLWLLGAIPLVFLVSIYPYFSIKAYFGDLKNYQGLFGLTWMQDRYPEYWDVVSWFSENVPAGQQPAIMEANGDSYTDADMVSAFSGLPTVAGWTVHEWLWRGGYDPIARRASEVAAAYEALNPGDISRVLDKYQVKYIVVGKMEREKYTKLNETNIGKVAKKIFTSGETTIYRVN